MNKIFKTMMIAGMAMAAFGMDRQLEFKTEMPVVVGKKTMPAGSFIVELSGANRQGVRIENKATKEGAFLPLAIIGDATPGSSTPMIRLECGSSACRVVEVSHLAEGKSHRSSVKPSGLIVAKTLTAVQAE